MTIKTLGAKISSISHSNIMRLGVQVSIQGGLDKAVDRALELNCNTFQFFSRNPREWRRHRLDAKEVGLFKRKISHVDLNPVIVQSPYTCNLASPRRRLFSDSVRAFVRDVKDANILGADYFVFHMGSHSRSGEKQGLERVAFALKKTLEEIDTKSVILMENTSGSGSWLGYAFWHHRFILKRLHWTNKIGLCLDTCHAWAAGYDISSKEGLKRLLEEIEREIGLQRLKVIHLNDSRDTLGSRRDRHQHIGQGFIGEEGFRHILGCKELRNLPFILETPNNSPADDPMNLAVARRIYHDL